VRLQGDGLVLFWSLKNPEFPMRALKAPCSVTALAFAKRSPHLLGVGLYDGTVAVRPTPARRLVLSSLILASDHLII